MSSADFRLAFFQLQLHQSSSEGYYTDVVSRTGLYGHHVALLQFQLVHVVVVAFAGVLELHLHQVGIVWLPGTSASQS